MYELLHNKTNSNYFIINVKLQFPEISETQTIQVSSDKINNKILHYGNDTIVKFKHKYIYIIRKWIQNILDQYSLLYNSVLFITNLNYDTIRIFIYFNPLSYSHMDNKHAIYLTNMINYESLCNIKINDFIKLFQIEKLNLLIELELNIIKQTLDSDSSSEESDTINHNFDIIDYDYFDKYNMTKTQLNKKCEHLFNHHRLDIIKIIGISGVNKITFINEIHKILIIQQGNLYRHNLHNNYDTELFVKIKENNKHVWVSYEKNKNIQNIIQLIFN